MRKKLTFTMNDSGKFPSKIKAIKGFRLLVGTGLHEAKEFVEKVQYNDTITTSFAVSPEYESEALAQMLSGGIIVLEPNNDTQNEIINTLKEVCVKALEAERFDIVKVLVPILEAAKDTHL